MTTARTQQIYIEDTPYYHCISRCVRRAFLCGEDPVSGQNYDHRKLWISNKIQQLSEIFSIDICAYAVMSNHYHLVLHIDVELNKRLKDIDVINRWTLLFSSNQTIEKYQENTDITNAEKSKAIEIIATWRERLMDISWFMRCLNEAIARQSNKEDKCTGRFWEGRFKSQALLDETALLSCMMYVDLNPIRAGIAQTPASSHFTSIKERIKAYSKKVPTQRLLPFEEDKTKEKGKNISFSIKDYIKLVKWAAKSIQNENEPSIPESIQCSMKKMGVNQKHWLSHIQHFEKHFQRIVGPPELLNRMSEKLGLWWIRGSSSCRSLYLTT